MEKEPDLNNQEQEHLIELADKLNQIQQEKYGEQGDVVMQKLIQRLRNGDVRAAKIFCANESDKFMEYRENGVPLIIEMLYGGSGSPWFTIERKLQNRQQSQEIESQE